MSTDTASEEFFRHRFDKIEDYLHHRSPYLLVSEIVELNEESITTSHLINESAGWIQGHFPGAQVMPGAMMQEFSTQSAGILIAGNFNPMAEYNTHDPFFNEYALGVLVKVKHAKYRGFARPGSKLIANVTLEQRINQVFDFSCKIECEGSTVMQNRFQLANIKSETLQGK